MTKYLHNLLKSLKNLVGSDLTCLVKYDQNNFEQIHVEKKDEIDFKFDEILEEVSTNDFQDILEVILSKHKFASYILNNFWTGNFQYFIFSVSRNRDYFDDDSINVQKELSDLIYELTSLNVNKINHPLAKEDYFPLFAESSNELVFILDQSGIITFVNKYGLKILKYNSDEILGKHFFELIKEEYKSEIGDSFQKIIDGEKEIYFDVELVPKISVEQFFKVRLVPVFNNGELEQLFGVGMNLTQQNIERKRNEALLSKLKEANRLNSIERDRAKQQISILNELNSLKNEFISNVSHELRTPLASIIGFSETILEDNNLTVDKAKEFNEVILTESKRLAKLINDVLDFSELENEKQQLEKNSTNIIDVLNDCINRYKDESINKNITLTGKIPESEIIIYADRQRLKKAFDYLLSNAIKFTHDNGRITLMAQEFLKEVEIVISDTGVGIAEQKIPLLFDKFSKVRRVGNNLPGAGFGLVTVKQIIDLHKGLIRVKSEVDKGTSFIIRLPKYSFN